MVPTFYLPIVLGLFALAIAGRRRLELAFGLLVLSLGFGGLSVMELPALGGSSMLGMQFMLVLIAMLTVLALTPSELADAARRHWAGAALCAYAILISFFGPRLFSYGVEVYPMRMDPLDMGLKPLGPASSNLAHTAYFCGSLVLAFLATALFRSRLDFAALRAAVLVLSAVHAIAGIADFAAGTAGQPAIFDFLRNANYAMVDQSIYGMKRAAGFFPEPSSYASLSVPLMIFCAELWLHRGDRTAGVVGLLVVLALFLSMSSTGFVGLGFYAVLLGARLVMSVSEPALFMRLLGLVATLFFVGFSVVMLMLLSPQIFGDVDEAVAAMTLQKAETDSADERTRWAMQGIHLLRESAGFGVGAGSFRSSSILTAWLGSFGLVGFVLILLYLAPVIRALGGGPRDADARVCAWTALGALVPLALVAPTPDPGLVFALFVGFVLANAPARLAARGMVAVQPRRRMG
jgi:hypothetical protein